MKKQPQIIPYGSDKKIKVLFSNLPAGVTMDTLDFTITFSSGYQSITFEKADLKIVDGVYYAALATAELEPGDLMLSAVVRIPDEDFADGIRHEYPTFDLNAKIVRV